jgi:hypothetical protein
MLLDFGLSEDFGTTPVFSNSQVQPGTIFSAAPTDGGIDTTANVPNWGAAEVMFVVNTSASSFLPGNLVQVDKNFAIAAAATTANTGAPVYVCLSRFTAGNTTRQCGWVLVAGICPATFSVAATTGAAFLGTSLNLTPTAAAGKQVLNATTLIAAAGSFTRSVTTQATSPFVKVARVNGIFVGQAVSGTGIPGASVVSSIDVGGTGFVIGSAVGTPVNATATGTVTGTFTHTGYGIVQINRPFVQGQIT